MLAEALDWPLKDFREAFREASDKGMVKADWEARLIFIPKAIFYNVPESPNVVRGWRIAWDELPECDLKIQIWKQLKAFIEGLTEGFREAFREACPQPLLKPLPNQEQEQEQEQEPKKEDISCANPKNPAPNGRISATSNDPGYSDMFEAFWDLYPRKTGKGDAWKIWKKSKLESLAMDIGGRVFLATEELEQWQRDEGRFIPLPATYLNQRRWEDELPGDRERDRKRAATIAARGGNAA